MVRAHLGPLKDQPLTIYFAGGFFFVASLVPGLDLKQNRILGQCEPPLILINPFLDDASILSILKLSDFRGSIQNGEGYMEIKILSPQL